MAKIAEWDAWNDEHGLDYEDVYQSTGMHARGPTYQIELKKSATKQYKKYAPQQIDVGELAGALKRQFYRPEQTARVAWAIIEGYGVRETARIAGCTKYKAARVRNLILRVYKRLGWDAPPCGCGSPAGHRAWCSFRYARSEARQEFMRRWHEVG